MTRVRWALAESGRRGQCVLERPGGSARGWWPVSDVVMDVHDAADRLHAGYGERAALIAALLDLEPGAVELACRLQPGDAPALVERLRGVTDPGAELARDA